MNEVMSMKETSTQPGIPSHMTLVSHKQHLLFVWYTILYTICMAYNNTIILCVYIHIYVCYTQLLSRVQLFATPWTVAHQAPLSMGFSRQEYWSGLPFLSPGDLPDPGIESRSSTLQAHSLLSELPGKPSELPRSQYPKYIKNSFKSASKNQTIQFENRRNM